eukprot:gene9808-2001_t
MAIAEQAVKYEKILKDFLGMEKLDEAAITATIDELMKQALTTERYLVVIDRKDDTESNLTLEVEINETECAIRNGMRKMMVARAVKSNPSASQDKIASVVCDVEDAIFAKFRNPNRLYKYQCRTRVNYIKADVFQRLLDQQITAETFSSMQEKDLMSEEEKQAIRKEEDKVLQEKNPGQKIGIRTNQLKCGKCGKKDVEYYEVQLRAADEPMTVIATCLGCGHRWRQ